MLKKIILIYLDEVIFFIDMVNVIYFNVICKIYVINISKV